ncbi:Ig-like domain-containing protein [Spirosoma areae]
MKKNSTLLLERVSLVWAVFCLSLLLARPVSAQSGNAACNTFTPPTIGSFSSVSVTSSQGLLGDEFSSKGNLIDNDPTFSTAATYSFILGGSAYIEVKDNNATGANVYPAGSFAGFVINNNSLLTAVGTITISTYLGNSNVPVDSRTTGSLVSTGILSGKSRVGFYSSGSFDRIRLTFSGLVTGSLSVFSPIVERFCSGPSLACADNTIPKNTLVPLNTPVFPVYVNPDNTGVNALVCALCAVVDPDFAVDNDPATFARVVLTAGVSTSATFSVANALDTYPANSFAGFDIETNTLVSASVLSTATIRLLNNGSVVQTSPGSNALIVGATTNLLTGRSRQTVGIVATVPYDEIQVAFAQLVGANLGTINIYNAVFEKTCPRTIACNTTYALNNPDFPVVINAERTGVTGVVAAATTIRDPWNAVSANTTDFARITNTGSVGTIASISVLDPVDTYPTGTFGGFTIRRVSGIAAVDLFSRLTITTYLDGVQKESRSAASLLDLSIALFGTSTDFINVGFTTSQPFDELQLSVANLVGLDALAGSVDVYGAFIDTRSSSGGGLVCALTTNPDFAVTNKNVPATGSVKTNDAVPAGTTYGPAPAPATQPGGSSPSLTVNSDGTFTFVSATPGVYVYNVPVCGAGQSGTACSAQTLTVTVLDPTVNTNKPVANPDIATTTGSPTSPTAITVNVRANDGPGNPGGTLGTPTIATSPTNGSAAVVGNNVVYTPNPGFYGTDMLTYQVCETPGGQCATATVTITVKAPGSANSTTAADDYISTYQGVAVPGNVKTNDTDPEGNTQTVTAQNTTIPGRGTLVLLADGSYTFTPNAAFTGPVDFTYTTCDNATPSVCASGTLHVLVNPFDPKPDFAVTNKNVPVNGSVKTNDIVPVGTTYGPAPAPSIQPAGSTPSLTVNPDGTYSFSTATPGVYVYAVPVCLVGQTSGCATQTLTVTVLDPTVNTNKPVANPDIATTTGSPTIPASVTINVRANDGPGNPGGTLGTPTIVSPSANGVAGVNGSGNVVYMPNPGFAGTDALIYQVCETPGGLCALAKVTITVKVPGSANSTTAADDYVSTPKGVTATGNVKTNDSDPEGNTQTVAAQNTTIPGKGTLVLTDAGSYTFTPDGAFTGPVQFTYTTCDNGSPSACANGTLHVLVGQAGLPDLTPVITLPQANFTPSGANSTRDFIVEIFELAGQSTSSGNAAITISAPSGYTLSFTNSLTSINVSGGANNPVSVDNTKWMVTSIAPTNEQISLKMNAGQFIAAMSKGTLGFTITRTTANTGSSSNITVNVTDDATKTYDSNPLNNVYARIITGL